MAIEGVPGRVPRVAGVVGVPWRAGACDAGRSPGLVAAHQLSTIGAAAMIAPGQPMPCEVCGDPVQPRSDRIVRYCSRRCCGIAKRGRTGPHLGRFNGGLSFDRESGRWKIMCRDGSQMWYYRGVMAAQIGRLLEPHELVHHDNEDPSDDRPENLVLTTRREHPTLHRLAA